MEEDCKMRENRKSVIDSNMLARVADIGEDLTAAKRAFGAPSS